MTSTLSELRTELGGILNQHDIVFGADDTLLMNTFINMGIFAVTQRIPVYKVFTDVFNTEFPAMILDGDVYRIRFVRVTTAGGFDQYYRPAHRATANWTDENRGYWYSFRDRLNGASLDLSYTPSDGHPPGEVEWTVECHYWSTGAPLLIDAQQIDFPEIYRPLVLQYATWWGVLAYMKKYILLAESSYPTYIYSWAGQLQALVSHLRTEFEKNIYKIQDEAQAVLNENEHMIL